MNDNGEKNKVDIWLNVTILLGPVLAVVIHILFPEITILKYITNIVVLLFVSFIFSWIPALIRGESGFSFHFGWMVLILIIGFFFFYKYGWISTAWLIGGCSLICANYAELKRRAKIDARYHPQPR